MWLVSKVMIRVKVLTVKMFKIFVTQRLFVESDSLSVFLFNQTIWIKITKSFSVRELIIEKFFLAAVLWSVCESESDAFWHFNSVLFI